MTLITNITPNGWRDLENTVADILRECGMAVQQQVNVPLPRGSVDLDVLAEEILEGIRSKIVCECKDWRTNVPARRCMRFAPLWMKRARTAAISSPASAFRSVRSRCQRHKHRASDLRTVSGALLPQVDHAAMPGHRRCHRQLQRLLRAARSARLPCA